MQGFESELGAALFDRQTKPLRATALGQRLYEPCRTVLQSVEAVRELAAADLPPSGGLRLGLMPLPLFERSGFVHKLDIVSVSDFKPQVDLWLVHGNAPGRLQGAVDDFAASVEQRLRGRQTLPA
ncbi:hypothetical protein [Pantoea sp. 18069]|uniref:hypothetical protein n=1 Tax=Pantoea sp. 18069 TaxID=2681415 RepID=UPI001F42EF48|nr:hypothetical protein [Pantoea sp. 18069]